MTQDLSLLRVFHAIMEERNVTAAAKRLGQSQSTVSAALLRLREALGDELFLRARYGVVPTEKAFEIAPDIADGIERLEQAFRAAEPFDPSRTTRRFRLLMGPYVEIVLVPLLAELFARKAPQAVLEITPLGPDLDPRHLAGHSVDMALGRFHTQPEELVVSHLFDDGFCCLVAPNALRDGAVLDQTMYQHLPHVVVTPPGKWRTGLHKHLEPTGLRRNTVVMVSHFLSVPPVVARLNGIATLPQRIADMIAGPYGLVTRPVPADLGTFPTQCAWHPRLRRDRGHAWLRDVIKEASATLTSSP